MPFDRGGVTVSTFKLNGAWPEDALENFSAHRAGTLDSVKDEPQIGWTTGRCLLDSNLEENNVITGSCWYLNLRKAERKIPASLLNAIIKREEIVYMRANELDFVPSKVKREIKAQAIEQYLMNNYKDLAHDCRKKLEQRTQELYSEGKLSEKQYRSYMLKFRKYSYKMRDYHH